MSHGDLTDAVSEDSRSLARRSRSTEQLEVVEPAAPAKTSPKLERLDSFNQSHPMASEKEGANTSDLTDGEEVSETESSSSSSSEAATAELEEEDNELENEVAHLEQIVTRVSSSGLAPLSAFHSDGETPASSWGRIREEAKHTREANADGRLQRNHYASNEGLQRDRTQSVFVPSSDASPVSQKAIAAAALWSKSQLHSLRSTDGMVGLSQSPVPSHSGSVLRKAQSVAVDSRDDSRSNRDQLGGRIPSMKRQATTAQFPQTSSNPETAAQNVMRRRRTEWLRMRRNSSFTIDPPREQLSKSIEVVS